MLIARIACSFCLVGCFFLHPVFAVGGDEARCVAAPSDETATALTAHTVAATPPLACAQSAQPPANVTGATLCLIPENESLCVQELESIQAVRDFIETNAGRAKLTLAAGVITALLTSENQALFVAFSSALGKTQSAVNIVDPAAEDLAMLQTLPCSLHIELWKPVGTLVGPVVIPNLWAQDGVLEQERCYLTRCLGLDNLQAINIMGTCVKEHKNQVVSSITYVLRRHHLAVDYYKLPHTVLNVSGLTWLKTLLITTCQAASIQVQHLENLEQFTIEWYKGAFVSLDHLPKLKTFVMRYCEAHSVTFDQVEVLESVLCAYCKNLNNIASLLTCSKLLKADIERCPFLPPEQIDSLRAHVATCSHPSN